MTHFFLEYGLFLAKAVTVVAAIVAIVVIIAAASRAAHTDETLVVDNLNSKYEHLAKSLKHVVLSKSDWKAEAKSLKEMEKARAKGKRPRTYVIDFKGDLKASAVASLREEVSAILAAATDQDQVVVRLENHGGVVHEHGLGASQLARIREANIPLLVVVDKVAASGGYLMACVANEIVAAPFAILGSIGVIAQLPNFHRMLDSHGVDFEQITAGEYKRNVTMFGHNTDADRAKLKEELEDIHTLFKAAVARYRPELDLGKVATGEHWYGTRALELGLADSLRTSDELLGELAADRDLYLVKYKIKQPLQKKLLGAVDGLLEKADGARWRKQYESRLPR